MEILLLVLIIPLIPFFIFSTLLSAWIFALGIPFIVAIAFGTFLRGLLLALFSKTIFPTLVAWKHKFHSMRKTGVWRDEPPSEDPMPATRPNVAPALNQRSEDISRRPSEKTTQINHSPFRSYALELENWTRLISELFFDQLYPDKSTMTPAKEKQGVRSVRDFVDSMALDPHNRYPKGSRQSLFDEMAIQSELSQPKYYSALGSEHSLFTAPTHRTILDDMADLSFDKAPRSALDDLVATADYLGDVSPGDSASQVGSDRGGYSEDYSRADVTDAAKLLSLFSNTKSQIAPVAVNTRV